MKFCVVMDESGNVLGRGYEQPYRYSTWTQGGGDFWQTFVPKESIFQRPDSFEDVEYIPAIFETREAAEMYIKGMVRFDKLSIVNLNDLELEEK